MGQILNHISTQHTTLQTYHTKHLYWNTIWGMVWINSSEIDNFHLQNEVKRVWPEGEESTKTPKEGATRESFRRISTPNMKIQNVWTEMKILNQGQEGCNICHFPIGKWATCPNICHFPIGKRATCPKRKRKRGCVRELRMPLPLFFFIFCIHHSLGVNSLLFLWLWLYISYMTLKKQYVTPRQFLPFCYFILSM